MCWSVCLAISFSVPAADQRQSHIRLAIVIVYFKKKLMSLMSLEVVLKCKLYFVQMVYFRAFQLLHQNVNIIVSYICVTCAMKSVSFVFRLGKECIVYCFNV